MTKPIITEAQFKALFPKASLDIYKQLITLLPKHDIATLPRVASFLAQCGTESGGFTVFVENLNYSADGLLKVFPKYFTPELATKYARKPESIANRVYANRMENGDEKSGDGWKFRGRGAIQITGKTNYKKLAAYLGKTLDETVLFCATPEGQITSAIWYWTVAKCNSYIDKNDIKGQTKAINGGYNGLEHRITLYGTATLAIKGNF